MSGIRVMKRKNIKTLYKVSILLIVIIAGLISVTNNRISVFACDSNNEIIANDEIDGITSMSNEAYLSVHYSDGTMGMIVFGNEQHLYEYKVVDSQYHILKCNCGATTGNKIRHTIDTTYVDPKGNGRYKPCVFCGAAIDTWEGGMYPGLLSDQIIYVLYEQRLGE